MREKFEENDIYLTASLSNMRINLMHVFNDINVKKIKRHMKKTGKSIVIVGLHNNSRSIHLVGPRTRETSYEPWK